MKALTIREPYASLIANGYKLIETRSWHTNYRGRIAIHSGLREWSGWREDYNVNWYDGDLHHGEIIAYADLVDCVPVEEFGVARIEENFGFYGEGRYAWVLANVVKLINPISRKGKQGLWEVEDGCL